MRFTTTTKLKLKCKCNALMLDDAGFDGLAVDSADDSGLVGVYDFDDFSVQSVSECGGVGAPSCVGAVCGDDCIGFATALDHHLYHAFTGGGSILPLPLPPGLLPPGGPGLAFDFEFTLMPLSYASPPLRAAGFFSSFLDPEDLLDGEEGARATLAVEASFADADSGPAFWSALRGACPALQCAVGLASMLRVAAEDAGQLVWPVGIRCPQPTGKHGHRASATRGYYELWHIAFALEHPAESAEGLLAWVAAAVRYPCARRGADVAFHDEGCSVQLFLRPPAAAPQEAVVKGTLFLPAAPGVAAEAQLGWRAAAPPALQRRRRRGRKVKTG